jgi:acyl-CoA synthetase (AMP-forming)/AMP-acid ligase II
MNPFQRLSLARNNDLVLGRLLEALAELNGDRPMVEEHGSGLKLTYREAADLVAELAAGIAAKAQPGDRVVIGAANGYEFFLLCLAATRAGTIAVPVNPQMTEKEVEYVIGDSHAQLVVRNADEVRGAGRLDDPIDVEAGDTAAIFYTSGTTGKPKGAELSHRALLGSALMATLYPAGLRRDEMVCGMPVAHIAGFTILLMTACLGVPLYLLPKFRPDWALDAIESRRATAFIGVPAMYRMMAEAGAEQRDLRSIRLWASGADAMPDDLIKLFKRLGATATLPVVNTSVGEAIFVDGYGMVELAGGAAIRISLPWIQLPLVPLPGYQLKAVDDQGNEVGMGEVGELAVKGPGVLKGYHGKKEATEEVLLPDGFLRTGDLAKRQPLGLVSLAGRKKHVIKHGGYSVFAVEVEHTLEEHPDVLEAAVVGLPDHRKGEIPVAVVRVREGATLAPDDLVTWAREHMAEYKAPRQVRVVDDLPRTGTEKVQKDKLKELFAEST